MVPLVLAALMLALTAADVGYNVYSTNKTTKASDEVNKYLGEFYGGQLQENMAFWDRYIRAHHLEGRQIRFPYRTGMNFNEKGILNADFGSLYNQYARYGSYVHGATSLGKSAGYGYYFATRPTPAFVKNKNMLSVNQTKLSDFYGN